MPIGRMSAAVEEEDEKAVAVVVAANTEDDIPNPHVNSVHGDEKRAFGVAARESQVWVGRVTILIASAVAAIAADIAVRPADEAKEAD